MITEREAWTLARGVMLALPLPLRQNLKAVHVMPKLHNGHLTIRVHMIPQIAEDPEPFVYTVEELA